MSTVLAIETSTEIASVALLYRDRIFVREASGVQNHSQSILPMVQEVLGEAHLILSQCDAVAFGSGPGSFTGVRTACGVTQGLAFGADIPVIPVVTLKAMAHSCRGLVGAPDVLAVLDARMGEVYWAQYRYADGDWQTVVEPTLSAPAAVAPIGEVVSCGNGLVAYSATFATRDFVRHGQPDVMPHASAIAQLGRAAFAQSQTIPARAAAPLYLRNKVALTTAERLIKAVS